MNPQNGQTPLDYLNQIAPQTPKRPLLRWNLKTILLAGVGALIVVILLAAVGSGISESRKEPWQRLSARLSATAEVVDGSSDVIKNSQLRSLNSDLKLYITNTQRDLATPLAALSINSAKLPASVIKSESSEKMAARLEDGRLNAKYDSTYAREMSYQLATLLALINQLYESNVGPETKTFLKGAYDNLQPTYKSIADFSASNE